ncbi:hypothetical protein ABYF34_05490 [Buchananella felis]|uniref:hypothetical protein n=1 Tax=Buchananella felis TaxID=3231492 RepID=UPI003528DAB3
MDFSQRRNYRWAVGLTITVCALVAAFGGGYVALYDEFWGAVVIVSCFLVGLILFYRMRDVHRGVRKTLFGDVSAAWNRDRDAGIARPTWRASKAPVAREEQKQARPSTAGLSKKAARQRAQVEAARRSQQKD